MKIQTHFTIGQRVFFLDENKVQTGRIIAMTINCYFEIEDREGYKQRIRYKVRPLGSTGFREFGEMNIFETKAELLSSL